MTEATGDLAECKIAKKLEKLPQRLRVRIQTNKSIINTINRYTEGDVQITSKATTNY